MTANDRLVGKSIPTREAVAKVTGKAIYIGDLKMPGMLQAKVVGSKYPHAIVKNVDAGEALALPGVKAVITKGQLDGDRLFGSNFTRACFPLNDHVRCVGDVVAAVAAETEEAAEKAVKLIKVQYEQLPAVYDAEEALRPGAPGLFPEGNITDPDGKMEELKYGDVDKGLADAELTVEGTFFMPKVVHAAMEPRACVACWEGDGLKIWATTQTPHYVRKYIAEYFQMPLDAVTVSVCTFGGGFGGKYQEEYILTTCLLARESGQPVKLVYTRDMENMIGRARYATKTEAKIGAKKDGTITAIDFMQYYDVGAYGDAVGGSGVTMGAVNASIYKTESCSIKAWNVCTNSITAQKFRSVYVPTYRYAVEVLMDMLEEKMGLEPGELRLNNTIKPGEKIMPYGNTMGDHALGACYQRAREEVSWSRKWKGWGKPYAVEGSKRKGLGVGFGVGWCDWYRERHGGTTIELHPDGRAVLITGVTDIGTGNLTTISQIIADVIGYTSIDNIEVRAPNTTGIVKDILYDEGTIASRVLFVGGWAAQMAANEAREKVLFEASEKMDIEPQRIEIADGFVYDRENSKKKYHFSEILTDKVLGFGAPPMPNVVGRAKRYEHYIAPVQVHIAEVEVDVETFEVRVINYVAAHDVGKAVNPVVVLNQLEGGITMGISTTLYEELVIDRETGTYANPDFVDYKVATIRDIPPIKVILVEDAPAEYGPFGAKGIGEHPLPPVYGAIANAVYSAVGVRPMELPITPERLMKLLKSKK